MQNVIFGYNPSPDLDQGDDRRAKFNYRVDEYSPQRLITKVPCHFHLFHGEADTLIDIEWLKTFTTSMRAAGNHCELEIYPNMPHCFFNVDFFEYTAFTHTTKQTDDILVQMEYLPPMSYSF